jgi:hypothetical protein
VLVIQMLTFPRFSPRLHLAMKMIDPAIVDPRLAELWRVNGLGLKRIERSSLKMFMANVPPSNSRRMSRLFLSTNYRPIPLVTDGDDANRVRIVGEGGRARTLRLGDGQYQLLVKPLAPEAPGAAPRIDILPIHHKQQHRFEPVPPDQTLLDGTPIYDLNLLQSLRNDEIWAIYANIPLPPNYEGQTVATPPSDKPIPLGQAMLTGQTQNADSQMILLIGYADLSQSEPEPTP